MRAGSQASRFAGEPVRRRAGYGRASTAPRTARRSQASRVRACEHSAPTPGRSQASRVRACEHSAPYRARQSPAQEILGTRRPSLRPAARPGMNSRATQTKSLRDCSFCSWNISISPFAAIDGAAPALPPAAHRQSRRDFARVAREFIPGRWRPCLQRRVGFLGHPRPRAEPCQMAGCSLSPERLSSPAGGVRRAWLVVVNPSGNRFG
jgi:hypothetical protein